MMSPTITVDRQRLQYAVTVADQAVLSDGYASLVLALADHSHIHWQHIVPGTDPVEWNSIFNIASISKPITVTSLMQLVERGRLVLRDPVASYIREFGQNDKEHVTIWQLITHTSGLDEPQAEEFTALIKQRAPLSVYLDRAYQSGLCFEPGSQWSYAQLTYSVLGEIITLLSGQHYPEFMRDHLFAPLGMVDTAFVPTDPVRLAPQFGNTRTEEGRAYLDSLAFPAFGLYSTAEDLVALGQALLNKGKRGTIRVLSEGAVEAMTRVHTDGIMSIENGRQSPTFQGLGWGMRSPYGNIIGSAQAYGHAGQGGSYMWIDPEWNLVFVLLSNSAAPQPNLATRLLNAVYGALERT